MKTPTIKTHKMKTAYEGHHFFILSKGMNAGKPLDKPCPNCFVLLAKDETQKIIFIGSASVSSKQIFFILLSLARSFPISG